MSRDPAMTIPPHVLDLSLFSASKLRAQTYHGPLVATASMAPSGVPVVSGIRCRRRPGHVPCTGRVMVCRQDVPAKVLWECPDCHDGGTITGWRGTHWDFSEFVANDETEGADLRPLDFSFYAFDFLRRVVPERRELQATVYRGWVDRDRVVVEAPLEDIETMADWMEGEVEALSGRRRTQLDRLCSIFERALGCIEPFPEYELEPQPPKPRKSKKKPARKGIQKAASKRGPITS